MLVETISRMLEFWNQRYGAEEYAYGTEANEFLKEALAEIPPGRILFPAEGEGRNAVYAAGKGWEVSAFDQSAAGREKAMLLAHNRQVEIDYLVGEFSILSYPEASFDAIALIYAHFPGPKKAEYHARMAQWLKPGGLIILEAFSKNHIECQKKDPRVGGPPDIHVLFSTQEVESFFPGYDFQLLEETEAHLHEGLYHIGHSSVVRAIGTKPL